MQPPSAQVTPPPSWLPIVGCYLAGVLAAAQLGKMSALAPLIAADLQLSPTTVKTYRDRAFERLGIHQRHELFALALKR